MPMGWRGPWGWFAVLGTVYGLCLAALVATGLVLDLRSPIADLSGETRYMGLESDTLLDFGTIDRIDGETLPGILERMRPADGRLPNVGMRYYEGGKLWFTFLAPTLETEEDDWVVVLEHGRVREARLILARDGELTERRWAFDDPARRAGNGGRMPVFPFTSDELAGGRVLIGYDSLGAMRPEAHVRTARAHAGIELREAVTTSILGGSLFAMAIYLLMMGARLGERSLLIAAGLSFFTGNFIFGAKGYVTSALLYQWPKASEIFLYATQPAFPAFVLVMIVAYLELDRRMPRLAATIMAIAMLLPFQGILVTATAVGLPIPFVAGNSQAVMVALVVALGTLVWFSLRGDRRARLFLVCMSPLAVAAIGRLVLYFGQTPSHFWFDVLNSFADVVVTMLLLGVLVVLDIQRREATLKREAMVNEERFRHYAEIASDSYFETDRSGRIVSAAGRVGRTLGFVENATLADILSGRIADDPAGAAARIASGDRIEPLRDVEIALRDDAGDPRWIAISAVPWHRDGDDGSGLRGTIADITEKVERRRSEARQATLSALGQLAGGVAHEVNNLLHPMINLARRVRDRFTTDEEARKLLDLVIVSGKHAGEIVSGVLNAFNPARSPGAVAPIEQTLAEAMDICRPTIPTTVVVVERIESSVGIEVPAGEMLQLVSNLLSNAIRAMDGSGRIEVSLVRTDDGAEIVFADDGPGMTEDIRRRVTEPFVSGRADGTGLGLSIVANIVDKWGGQLAVESSEGKGTRVVVNVPE
jgi:PAS domain S-box-containing protein